MNVFEIYFSIHNTTCAREKKIQPEVSQHFSSKEENVYSKTPHAYDAIDSVSVRERILCKNIRCKLRERAREKIST